MNEAALVELRNVCKRYPGVVALDDVTLTLRAGTVTALAGENGAGKSTLIKVLSGAVRADSGEVRVGGKPLPSNPGDVIRAGVSTIYQELTDVPEMSVLDNVLLARHERTLGFLREKRNRRLAAAALARVGLKGFDLHRPLSSLSPAQRQLLEIARCLARDARVLIFDEPTSSLPEADVEALKGIIRQLRGEGLAILYVSHHLEELFAIADDIIVMRDGSVVASSQRANGHSPNLCAPCSRRISRTPIPGRTARRARCSLRSKTLWRPACGRPVLPLGPARSSALSGSMAPAAPNS